MIFNQSNLKGVFSETCVLLSMPNVFFPKIIYKLRRSTPTPGKDRRTHVSKYNTSEVVLMQINGISDSWYGPCKLHDVSLFGISVLYLTGHNATTTMLIKTCRYCRINIFGQNLDDMITQFAQKSYRCQAIEIQIKDESWLQMYETVIGSIR